MESLYSLVHEVLKNRGIKPNDESPGSFTFSVNGLNFVCDTNDNDPFFFRLSLPRINRPETQISELDNNIQQLNRMFKVTKIVSGNDNFLWIIADTFVYSSSNFELLFNRLLQAMSDMINSFHSIENRNTNGTVQS